MSELKVDELEDGLGGTEGAGGAVEALFRACIAGDTAALGRLLQLHPELDLNACNKSGEGPVHAAASGGHLEIIKLLHMEGASLSLATMMGEALVHCAARSGSTAILSFLCEQKTDLNEKNEAGETAVHLATRQGHVKVVEFLRLAGADVNVQNNEGCTALHLACQKRHSPIAHVLLHLGCRMDLTDQMDEMALHDACREGLVSVVQTMCAYGCPVDMESKSGMTPLHVAAKEGNAEIVRCLLLSNVEVDKQNKDGLRAEDIALAHGHTDIADMLSYLASGEERREPLLQQLLPTTTPLPRVCVKVLGHSGVGKSSLIAALRCGYLRSWVQWVSGGGTLPEGRPLASTQEKEDAGVLNIKSSARPSVTPLSTYTRGIDIQQCSIEDVGEVSLWEWSSYEGYLGVAGRLVGGANSLYLVLVSLKDSPAVRTKQLHHWLAYIRARTAHARTFGPRGVLQRAPHVAVVATHADVGGCTRGERGGWVLEGEGALIEGVKEDHGGDLSIVARPFILDARAPSGLEMRYLRVVLGELRKYVLQGLPPRHGLLDPTLAELPAWTRTLGPLPLLRWPSFCEYVRTKISMLATEDHLKELVSQLQLIGEVVSLTSQKGEVWVVLSPPWLGTGVLGPLMSYEHVQRAPGSGRLGEEDLGALYPSLEPREVASLLDMLNVCNVNNIDGELQCDVPWLNTTPPPASLYGSDASDSPDPLRADMACGGLKFVALPDLVRQLVLSFPDIQLCVVRALRGHGGLREERGCQGAEQGESEEGHRGQAVTVWRRGLRVRVNKMAAVLRVAGDEKSLELMLRGPDDQRETLFHMQEDLCALVYIALEECCPGLYLERHPISVQDLRQGVAAPTACMPVDIFHAHLDGKSKVSLSSNKSRRDERLVDLLAYGSPSLLARLTLGPDLPASLLPLPARRRLAAILDEPSAGGGDKAGRDWAALAARLGVPGEAVARLSVGEEASKLSKTDRLLDLWARQGDGGGAGGAGNHEGGGALAVRGVAAIRVLRQRLTEIGRPNASALLAVYAPVYVYTPKS